jgi:hypothetical protein
MTKEWTDEHQSAAFEAFWDWKTDLYEKDGLSLGDHEDDWGFYWEVFLAGYKKGAGYD